MTYFAVTTAIFCVGFVLYGAIAVVSFDETVLNRVLKGLLAGLAGGCLLGGLLSGTILFTRFISQQSLTLKVLASCLFMVSFLIIVYMGIFSFVPYYIYNLIKLRKEGSRDNNPKP